MGREGWRWVDREGGEGRGGDEWIGREGRDEWIGREGGWKRWDR